MGSEKEKVKINTKVFRNSKCNSCTSKPTLCDGDDELIRDEPLY